MTFTCDWIKVPTRFGFKCQACGSQEIEHRVWESSCGGFEDFQYHCLGCDRRWWVDGIDS